ncbi:MAG: insulinase family protein, partial [Candidatus Eremiobacteraeota bacterium]|nr:insulinase family protein [Candidatus Eremiobacteraeota bacterium]
MNKRRTAFALLWLTAIAPAAVRAADQLPAPALENAGGTTIVRQSDPRSSLVGVAIVVHAGLNRQTMRQNGVAALVAQTILTTPVTLPAKAPAVPMPLEEAIAASGGSVHFSVDPDDVRFYVESLAADASVAVGLMRQALSAPDFSAATVRAARTALIHELAQSQQYSQYALQ